MAKRFFFVSAGVLCLLLAALVGFILLAAIVIYVRVWWLRRKFSAAARETGAGRAGTENVVEGEYRVVDITGEDKPEHKR